MGRDLPHWALHWEHFRESPLALPSRQARHAVSNLREGHFDIAAEGVLGGSEPLVFVHLLLLDAAIFSWCDGTVNSRRRSKVGHILESLQSRSRLRFICRWCS